MADIHGSPADPGLQMPQAGNSGPAPLPYAGPDLRPEPPDYAVDLGPLGDPAASVMAGVVNLGTTEDPSAHDINAGLVTPYYAGDISPVNAAGDADAGGRDDVSATVGGAVAAATGRWHEFQSDTYGEGSVIGDLMTFPPSPEDPGAGVGNTLPTAGFYDPDRDYGGTQGAPGYEGKAQ